MLKDAKRDKVLQKNEVEKWNQDVCLLTPAGRAGVSATKGGCEGSAMEDWSFSLGGAGGDLATGRNRT